MTDFLAIFSDSNGPAVRCARADEPAHGREFSWGRLAVYGEGAVLGDGSVCVVVAGEAWHERGRATEVLKQERSGSDSAARGTECSGMFAACVAGDDALRVVTDRMGFRPVYLGVHEDGSIGAVGTHPDHVASAVGAGSSFSALAVTELLLLGAVTFPHTLHERVTELAPGATHVFESGPGGIALSSASYWRPVEPAGRPSFRSCLNDAIDAVRAGGRAVSDRRDTIGIMLSGGRDSRATLGALGRTEGVTALTFADRINNETRVAAEVAKAAGVEHRVLLRSERFYEQMPVRTTRLVGGELATFGAHGWVMAERGLTGAFDVVTGGFLGDALLRADGSPYSLRSNALRHSFGERWFADTRTRSQMWSQLPARRGALQPALVEAALRRFDARIDELREIRPRTAVEWASLYPASRSRWMVFALANARQFPLDELFMHKETLEVAAATPTFYKASGRLFRAVFMAICPELWRLPVAHDGLPASARWLRRRLARSRRKAYQRVADERHERPWTMTSHSWQDPALMQRLSPAWQDVRGVAGRCPAGLAVLDSALSRPARDMVSAYDQSVDPMFNYCLVQLAIHGQAMQDGWSALESACEGRGAHAAERPARA